MLGWINVPWSSCIALKQRAPILASTVVWKLSNDLVLIKGIAAFVKTAFELSFDFKLWALNWCCFPLSTEIDKEVVALSNKILAE